MGRLTRDAEIRYSQGQNGEQTAIARFTLAVDRRGKDGGADFISCVAFGRTAEFCEKWTRQGMKVALDGRIQTGSYTNKDGVKVYTTDVIVENIEFAESKNAEKTETSKSDAGFISIPDGIENDLPFK
jgi:single-strand DNA-binding protein